MRSARRVAVVTGGTSGIGRASAEALASRGFDVIVMYGRSVADAKAALKSLRALAPGGRHEAVRADVSRRAEVERAFAGVARRHGRLDALVNSAAFTAQVPADDLEGLDEALVDRVLAVNVKGVLNCCRAALRLMEKTRRAESAAWRGSIVNLSSNAVSTLTASNVVYVASKAAVDSLTRSLAKAFGDVARVNAVAPGYNRTRLTAKADPARRRRALRLTPLGRLSEPRDAAAAVAALAVDLEFVHGQVVRVDGGRS
jgi:3-oxoacyl-[acyl-carrier protein] reductase